MKFVCDECYPSCVIDTGHGGMDIPAGCPFSDYMTGLWREAPMCSNCIVNREEGL